MAENNVEEVKEAPKYDMDKKLRIELIPPEAIFVLTRVYMYGVQKYYEHSWRQGITWSKLFGAILRHVYAWFRGEENDPESKLPHLAHAAWNCLTLLMYHKYLRNGKIFDDRPIMKRIKEEIAWEKEQL